MEEDIAEGWEARSEVSDWVMEDDVRQLLYAEDDASVVYTVSEGCLWVDNGVPWWMVFRVVIKLNTGVWFPWSLPHSPTKPQPSPFPHQKELKPPPTTKTPAQQPSHQLSHPNTHKPIQQHTSLTYKSPTHPPTHLPNQPKVPTNHQISLRFSQTPTHSTTCSNNQTLQTRNHSPTHPPWPCLQPVYKISPNFSQTTWLATLQSYKTR